MDINSPLMTGIASLAKNVHHNYYSLSIDRLNALTQLSVVSLNGQEVLNEPWHYEITFTSPEKQLDINAIL